MLYSSKNQKYVIKRAKLCYIMLFKAKMPKKLKKRQQQNDINFLNEITS